MDKLKGLERKNVGDHCAESADTQCSNLKKRYQKAKGSLIWLFARKHVGVGGEFNGLQHIWVSLPVYYKQTSVLSEQEMKVVKHFANYTKKYKMHRVAMRLFDTEEQNSITTPLKKYLCSSSITNLTEPRQASYHCILANSEKRRTVTTTTAQTSALHKLYSVLSLFSPIKARNCYVFVFCQESSVEIHTTMYTVSSLV